MGEESGPVAALDCGTNSTRLLIVDDGGRTLAREMRITRLGQGVDASRRLDPAAMERTVAVLTGYREVMDRHGVVRARLVATSAARDAANGAEFLAAAREATGVEPELLSGLDEGRLSFAGATARLPEAVAGAGGLLVCDIGGGSTELAVGRAGRPEGVEAVSLDVGCVRLTERFLHHDPPTAGELEGARREVAGLVAGARAALPAPDPGGPVVGLAGTVSTLASLAGGLEHYDRDAVHHAVLSRDEVRAWAGRLAADDRVARGGRPGMEPGRVDVIVGGVLVLVEVMAAFDRGSCLVSEDDILDGLAASLR